MSLVAACMPPAAAQTSEAFPYIATPDAAFQYPGSRRILASTSDPDRFEEFRPPTAEHEHPLDCIDIAIDHAGETLWVVDNDNHRVWRLNIQTGEYRKFGERGESLGQFDYPVMIAINSIGDVFITEALNGRVQIIEKTGRVVGSLATYGVDLGNEHQQRWPGT